jgi:hypothetical protein
MKRSLKNKEKLLGVKIEKLKFNGPLGFFTVSLVLVACAPSVADLYIADSSSSLANSKSNSVHYSGPLVVKKGGIYSGNWESKDPNVPAVSIQTSEPVTIENANIRSKGSLIKGFGNRIVIRNVKAYGLNPNIRGRSVGWFVSAEEFYSVRVENSYAENTLGIYLRKFKGNPESGETATIIKNKFKNVNGLPSNGSGGYLLDKPDGIAHTIQFNDVTRIKNAEIAWNEIVNEPGKSQVEENINMYVSGGTPDSPILIHDNYIQGGYNAQPTRKTGYAGGGIIVGDGSIYNPSVTGYTKVYKNQIVSTTNQGIAIAGGTGNHVYENRIIGSGLLPDGSRIVSQNVGIYMWNSDASKAHNVSIFANNSMSNNYVAWTKVGIDGNTTNNPWWLPDCTTGNSTCGGNVDGGKATLEAERQEYINWRKKLSEAQIFLGPNDEIASNDFK